MALGDLRCITGLTLNCWLTNKWNWSLINIWNRIYQHSTTGIKPKTRCDFGGTWQLRFIRNSLRVPAQPLLPKLYFSTSNEPQLPHFLSKLAFNINWSRRSLNSWLTEQAPLQSEPCGVICSDINKYDKHLSWSCIQWERVWFNIKRHISADRRKRASFISDKWGGEEFWKFPLGCNNNWSQTFFVVHVEGGTLAVWHIWLVMWRPHGLARRIGECLGKRSTLTLPSVRSHQIKTRRSKQVEHTLPALPCHYQTSARRCHV